jgi:hypothetical protein
MESENQTPRWNKLLLESFVIVTSILLAFGIDAGWDGFQAGRDQEQLEDALREELIEAHELTHRSVQAVQTQVDLINRFLEATNDPSAIPIDSLQAWLVPAFKRWGATAPLPVYREAVATGSLADLENPRLSGFLIRYDLAQNFYLNLEKLLLEALQTGYLHDLSEELGSLYAFTGPTNIGFAPKRFLLGDAEYRAYIQQPHVYARIEGAKVFNANLLDSPDDMDRFLEAALEALEVEG